MSYEHFRFGFQLSWAPLTIQAILSEKSTKKLPEFFSPKIRRLTETIEMSMYFFHRV
jgi:hypothetical protein